MNRDITLIDYGVGNIFSVTRALEHCGARVTLSSDADTILRAPRLLFPGVGAFNNAMDLLIAHGLDEAIKEAVRRGTPLLGICLGMQLLLDSSEEFGGGAGLGLIPGTVVPIPDRSPEGALVRIPHIGWNSLIPAAEAAVPWAQSPLRETSPGDAMYFVHSFMACPQDPAHRIADCLYGGTRVAAVVAREHVWGAQFHPEKSGLGGLRILRHFLEN